MWKLYPRKQGKSKAKSAYERARKNGTTKEEVESGVRAYVDFIKRNSIDAQYVKMGSTFFNQQAWSDDWSVNFARGQPTLRAVDFDPEQRKEYRAIEI